jgi:hypothetical protein
MSCAECGANLDDTPTGEPCPACRGLRRNITHRAAASLVVVATMRASMTIEYAAVRPWQQKWRDVLDGLAEIERVYDQEDMSNEPVRRAVEDFFADCRELADWLEENAAVPDAQAFVLADPVLHLCDGMAQTTKHHTRRRPPDKDPDPITAQISRIEGGSGVRAEIHWLSVTGKSGDEDALDLAHRCVAAWRRFFAAQGLDPEI